MKQTLVIGTGFLGSSIIKKMELLRLPVKSTSFNSNIKNTIKLDIRNVAEIRKCVENIKPDLIINCAANTDMDLLEKNPELAFSINAEGAGNVAKISKDFGCRLIHISTDNVFDGKKGMYSEEDLPNPINVYAKSKVSGEELVKENAENYLIIRTSFVGYDINERFLFNWIIKTLKESKEIVGFTDAIFTPLEVSNLSQIILEFARTSYNGIIHLSSDRAISKYEFALMIADVFGFNRNLIKKGSIDNVGFLAKRPKNISLSNNKAKKLMNFEIIELKNWMTEIKHSLS